MCLSPWVKRSEWAPRSGGPPFLWQAMQLGSVRCIVVPTALGSLAKATLPDLLTIRRERIGAMSAMRASSRLMRALSLATMLSRKLLSTRRFRRSA